MPPEESKMLVYAALADLARRRRQYGGSDRFLVLAGAAACRAGWPAVADRCRELVLADNPAHLVGRWPTFADALRDSDFAPFLKRLERFCPLERGELILRELDEPPVAAGTQEGDPGTRALVRLAGSHWDD
ncbi:MAG: hypothetical protein WD069_22670 [Planctomycetales bacterium]